MHALPTVLSRRSFFAAAGLAVGATALAACSSSEAPSTGAAPSPATPAAAAFPVTIPAVEGEVTIKAAPAKVVSVGTFRDVDAAVALGVVPLATADISTFIEGGISPWVKAKLGSQKAPELLDTSDALPFEKVAALAPDLILATDDSSIGDEYAQLSQLAPTLSSANGYNKDTWQVTTGRIGKALGRDDAATGLVAQVEGAITAAKAANPGFAGKTFTIGPVTADGTVNTINSDTDASAVFMKQLGLTLSPKVLGLPSASLPGRAVVGPENLAVLDADVLILTFNTPAARQQLEASTVFQKIPAVVRGSYIALDLPTAIAIGFPSALSIPYALEQSVPKIAAALAKS
jgi:iron complex transport system substrate-binding protein